MPVRLRRMAIAAPGGLRETGLVRSLRALGVAALVAAAVLGILLLWNGGPRGVGPERSPTPTPSVAPTLGDAGVWVAAAGDIACRPEEEVTPGRCHQQATSDLIASSARDVIAVLPLGDLQYERATLAEFRASYAESWGRFDDIAHPVPGNHEYADDAAEGYFRYFGRAAGRSGRGWYSFELPEAPGWHFIALNSNCGPIGGCGPGSPQYEWLLADLGSHPNEEFPCTLAYWHHPLFSSSAISGGEDAVAPFWRALQDAGADLVLNGHSHVYERFAPQDADGSADRSGLREIIAGTGGRDLYPFALTHPNSEARGREFGVLMLRLDANGYAWEFVPERAGTFTDAGTATCR